jgi:hypothetical protein
MACETGLLTGAAVVVVLSVVAGLRVVVVVGTTR